MNAIERDFEPLKGVLPKDYGIFEPRVLEGLMRTFNSEQVKDATGDVFGRIYEYFLAKFSIQKAHDNGEFFTRAFIVLLMGHQPTVPAPQLYPGVLGRRPTPGGELCLVDGRTRAVVGGRYL